MLASVVVGVTIIALSDGDPHFGPGSDSFIGSDQQTTAPVAAGAVSPIKAGEISSPLPPPCGPGNLDEGPCRPATSCVPFADSPTGYELQTVFAWKSDFADFSYGGPCEPSSANGPSVASLVLRAFQRIPLPQPVLSIQPPKGKTLIGLETIFSTNAEPFTRTVNLLGRQVQLQIEATSFDWIHGDSTTQTTDWSGRPWERGLPMDRYITHTYEDTGTVRPQVRVTWSADYRVGNGPWQPVNGTVDRTSNPATLQIVEAEPHLAAP